MGRMNNQEILVSIIRTLFRLVGDQPYLVRCGLHEVVLQEISLAMLEGQANRDKGLFGDHLRRVMVLLTRTVT